MKNAHKIASILIMACLLVPGMAFANSGIKVFTGTVTKISGNQITFRTSSAAAYTAETGSAILTRRNGANMDFAEIMIGDKVEVKGNLWPDNSINAITLRNQSLYAHNGTFSGKISSVDLANSSFTLQSKQYGSQAIRTDRLTVFKKNGKNSTLRDMELNISATVKGVWDRTNTQINAKTVEATVRLVNIDFNGTLMMKTSDSLTVTANNNVIYAVDITKAKLQNKSGKSVSLEKINLGDTLKIQGKHISESPQVTASIVKDLSVSK